MAARDVVTAASVQLMSMIEKGKEEGVLVATVTVPVNKTDGEVSRCSTLETASVTVVLVFFVCVLCFSGRILMSYFWLRHSMLLCGGALHVWALSVNGVITRETLNLL